MILVIYIIQGLTLINCKSSLPFWCKIDAVCSFNLGLFWLKPLCLRICELDLIIQPIRTHHMIPFDQSEASIEVTWSVLTNQRPVFTCFFALVCFSFSVSLPIRETIIEGNLCSLSSWGNSILLWGPFFISLSSVISFVIILGTFEIKVTLF